MPQWFDEFCTGFTAPFRAVTEAVLFVPTVTTAAILEVIAKVEDPEHEFDISRDFDEVKEMVSVSADVAITVAGVVTPAPIVFAANIFKSGSNLNEKLEEVRDKEESETVVDRLQMLPDLVNAGVNAGRLARN